MSLGIIPDEGGDNPLALLLRAGGEGSVLMLDNHATYLMPDGLRYKAVRAGEELYYLYARSAPAWDAPKYELRPDGEVYCRYGRHRVCAGEELIPETPAT